MKKKNEEKEGQEKVLETLGVDFGREDLNLLRDKINELIKFNS